MKTILRLFLLVPLLSSLMVAREGDKGWSNRTGNDLLPACAIAVDFLDHKDLSKDQGHEAFECLMYVAGYLNGYGMASTVEKGKPALCFPENTSTGQIIRVFAKWMKDHPERLSEPAANCMFAALSDAFGCKYPK